MDIKSKEGGYRYDSVKSHICSVEPSRNPVLPESGISFFTLFAYHCHKLS